MWEIDMMNPILQMKEPTQRGGVTWLRSLSQWGTLLRCLPVVMERPRLAFPLHHLLLCVLTAHSSALPKGKASWESDPELERQTSLQCLGGPLEPGRELTACALPWSVLQKEKPSCQLSRKLETSLWGLSPVTGWPDSHGSVEIENMWDCCSCQATSSYTLTWPSQEGCLMQSEILGSETERCQF